MSVAFVLFLTTLLVIVAVWVVVTLRQPPIRLRRSAGYRHTENPDYMPGHTGQSGI